MEPLTFMNTVLPQLFGSQLIVAAVALVGLVLTSVAIARDVAIRRLDISQTRNAFGGIA